MAQAYPYPNQLQGTDEEKKSYKPVRTPSRRLRQARRRRGPNCRHWVFTSFLEKMRTDFDEREVRYIVFQQESAPSTNAKHFQGYVEFYNKHRMGQVKTFLTGSPHVQPRKGTRDQARAYCMKEDTRIDGTLFEFGIWRQDVNSKLKLADMLLSGMSLKQIVNDSPVDYVRYYRGMERLFMRRAALTAKEFRKINVVCYIGPTGCGKTQRAAAEPNCFFMPLTDGLWFDGYEGEATLVLDDFYGNIKYSMLLRILDGHQLQLPVKTAFVWALYNKIVITSNKHPDLWYKNMYPDGMSPALKRRITSIILMK